ncbi:ATP-dependent DNA ligase [Cyathus striatus]|nr:ATP-dependent DNA ligase [Cyathus striatus]
MSVAQGGVTFTYFCSLLREIAKIHPRKWSNRHTLDTHPALDIFKRWLDSLRIHFSPLPTHTVAICLRFLFPEEDIRRKYEIQEARLIKHLTESLGLNKDALKGWSDEESVGCLGEEVKKALERTCPHPDGFISSVTIAQIDKLLDELASISKFSHTSIQESHSGGVRRQRAEIISSLFRKLSPMDAGFLTQIILKDLRPILYSISELHYSTALRTSKAMP